MSEFAEAVAALAKQEKTAVIPRPPHFQELSRFFQKSRAPQSQLKRRIKISPKGPTALLKKKLLEFHYDPKFMGTESEVSKMVTGSAGTFNVSDFCNLKGLLFDLHQ